jgi:four helix bundle protein
MSEDALVREGVSQYGVDLRIKTRKFAIAIIEMYGGLPRGEPAYTLGKQALRSGTSIGAHYREACRSRSNAELVSKFEVAVQELDETIYWLELLEHSQCISAGQLETLAKDADELIRIFVASVKKLKGR